MMGKGGLSWFFELFQKMTQTITYVNHRPYLNKLSLTQIVILRDIGWKELRAVVAYMYRVRLLAVCFLKLKKCVHHLVLVLSRHEY